MTESPLPPAGESQPLPIAGPAGRLEAILAMPREAPRGIAVICHPHPLYGGAMSNKVVYTLNSSALKAGLAALRFNFRGVGRSEGLYDDTRGETQDALAAVEFLRERLPGLPLTLAGFSFGAYVALKAAGESHPHRLISISIPFGKYVDAGAAPPPHPHCAWLAVHSRDDEVVEFESTHAVLASYSPAPEQVVLDGAGHFYHGRLVELQDVLAGFLAASEPPAAAA